MGKSKQDIVNLKLKVSQYEILSYEQVVQFLKSIKIDKANVEYTILTKYPLYYSTISKFSNNKFNTNIILMLNNLLEVPLCKCSKPVKPNWNDMIFDNICTSCHSWNLEKQRKVIPDQNVDVKKLLEELVKTKTNGIMTTLTNKYPTLIDQIIELTAYLNPIKFTERIYHIVNNLTEIQKCKCGDPMKFYSLTAGYRICKQCASQVIHSEDRVNRMKLTKKTNQLSTLLEYYEDNSKFELLDYSNYITDNEITVKCKSCEREQTRATYNKIFVDGCGYCNTCGVSGMERDIQNELILLGLDIECNKRKPLDNKFEIDILIPKYNLGIELDGLYYHSDEKKDKSYHINKTELCNTKGINLIHIFEDEWLEKKNIILSIIKYKTNLIENKIDARKCEIKKLEYPEYKDFFDNNHIAGNTHASHAYGLLYNDKIVSALSIGKRKITNGDPNWEIIRFANLIDHNVRGSFSKLFKHTIETNNIDKIKTYADLRFGNGDVYLKNGFTLKHKSKPSYFYTFRQKRFHRSSFMKHMLPKRLKTFDPDKTEYENMIVNGYGRIWDCGCMVFEYIR